MEARQKELLIRSIKHFRSQDQDNKDLMVKDVENKIKQHYNGLYKIGFGYADYYVKAAEVFIRVKNLI